MLTEIKNTIFPSNELAYIGKTLQAQREFFQSGITKDLDFRIVQLKKLRTAIQKHENAIYEALKADLNKPKFESYGTEIGFALSEIDLCIRKIKKWAKPRKVGTAPFHFKASSYVYSDPYGLVLNIAPWNYPFQLLFVPVIGAMAAGNCIAVKPSELAPNMSELSAKIIQDTFDENYISVFEGGIPVSQELLKHKFDYIFFTGSTRVGKIVYQAAAKHLTPVTLELGGKSPCIVDKDVNLDVAAKRIVWGKLVNAGQTCIAPDYLMVHTSVKEALIPKMEAAIEQFYGKNPEQSEDYCRIINEGHFKRLEGLMKKGRIISGGVLKADEKYISPTLLEDVSAKDPVMKEEIFGPILPIITYENLDETIQFINDRPKPLALYVFTKNNKVAEKVLKETSSGGACVNDTLMHIANPNMSFGGVGESGIGGYHGKFSFDTFSHQKAVMHKSTAIDPYIRYAPYKTSLNILKFLLSKFG